MASIKIQELIAASSGEELLLLRIAGPRRLRNMIERQLVRRAFGQVPRKRRQIQTRQAA